MGRKRFTPEQIIAKLQEVKVPWRQGKRRNMAAARWWRRWGGQVIIFILKGNQVPSNE